MAKLSTFYLSVLCTIVLSAFSLVQQDSTGLNLQLANPNAWDTFVFTPQGTGYVMNMTYDTSNMAIMPANSTSTQNFTMALSFFAPYTFINSSILQDVTYFGDGINEDVNSPYFSSYDYDGSSPTSVYLGYWMLANTTYAWASGSDDVPFFSETDGYIGLGNGLSLNVGSDQGDMPNQWGSQQEIRTFAIWFGMENLYLALGSNPSKTSTPGDSIVTIFASPSNGKTSLAGDDDSSKRPTSCYGFVVNSVQVNGSSISAPPLAGTSINAIFDVNTESIWLPSQVYSNLTNYLCDSYCSACGTTNDSRNFVTCDISSISELPSLTIEVAFPFSGQSGLPLGPEIYADTEIINNQTTVVFYFTQGPYYWFVLGSKVMQAFYLEFESQTGNYYVTLYPAAPADLIQSIQDSDSDSVSDSDSTSDIEISDLDLDLSDFTSDADITSDESDSQENDTVSSIQTNTSNIQNFIDEVEQNLKQVLDLQTIVKQVSEASSANKEFTSIISDINNGMNDITPLLKWLGIYSDVSPLMSAMGSFLSKVGTSNSTSQVTTQLNTIMKRVNQVSEEVGQVSEQISEVSQEIFNMSQTITNMLTSISQDVANVSIQISQLQGQEQSYFKTLIDDTEADTCYALFSNYESIITGGMQNLQALANNNDSSLASLFQLNFMDGCTNCAEALQGLLSAFNQDSDQVACSIIEVLQNGDASYDYNDQVSIAAKGSYLLQLVNLGMTVLSAYESIQANSTQAWIVVQEAYNQAYTAAVQNLQNALLDCYTDFQQDFPANLQNYTAQVGSGVTVTDVVQFVSQLYPWMGWVVISPAPIEMINACDACTFSFNSSTQIYIQPFNTSNGFGNANIYSEFVWDNLLHNYFNDLTYEFSGQFSDSLTGISYSDAQDIQIGTNLFEPTGSTYDFSDFMGGYQIEEGFSATIYASKDGIVWPSW